jgi:hypothetical protein
MHYAKEKKILDLEKKAELPSQEATVYLLEINARPPGCSETVAVNLTYGVDYFALRILLYVGNVENT